MFFFQLFSEIESHTPHHLVGITPMDTTTPSFLRLRTPSITLSTAFILMLVWLKIQASIASWEEHREYEGTREFVSQSEWYTLWHKDGSQAIDCVLSFIKSVTDTIDGVSFTANKKRNQTRKYLETNLNSVVQESCDVLKKKKSKWEAQDHVRWRVLFSSSRKRKKRYTVWAWMLFKLWHAVHTETYFPRRPSRLLMSHQFLTPLVISRRLLVSLLPHLISWLNVVRSQEISWILEPSARFR